MKWQAKIDQIDANFTNQAVTITFTMTREDGLTRQTTTTMNLGVFAGLKEDEADRLMANFLGAECIAFERANIEMGGDGEPAKDDARWPRKSYFKDKTYVFE